MATRPSSPPAAVVFLLLASLVPASSAARRVETLRARNGLPAHIAGQFREPLGFQQADSGEYLVFDRRGHSVYEIDEGMTTAKRILQIGQEEGRIIEPSAFDMEPHGIFVIADAPRGLERVQRFGPGGSRLGGFTLPGRNANRVTIGTLVLNGVGSLQFTGRSVLINQPETGSLVTEYDLSGTPFRTFGSLRSTGQESDREVHLGLNVGIPLVNPKGGYYFAFMTGEPIFQKYDASGKLMFERHIEGRELDDFKAALPTTWTSRRSGPAGQLPLIRPTLRTAAVDRGGNLWIGLMVPYTYVYDPDGEKIRVVQFEAAGVITPTSMFFTRDGRLLVTPGCFVFEGEKR